MLQTIGLILSGIGIAIIFVYLRGKILNKVSDTAKEQFDIKKFRAGLFRVRDKVIWVKDFVQIFNVRKIVIYLVVASIIYGVGQYKGRLGKPIQVNLNYEKEFKLKVDGNYLLKPKNSKQLFIVDEKGNKIKDVTVGDVKELKKKLKPFGLQFVPIGIMGYGTGLSGYGFEGGGGISFLKYFKWRLETFLTNKGIYLGSSYKITDNSGLGIGGGKGFKGDNRVIIYYRWKF
jgi:hypothetical protein